jgi:hypothetical protein
VGLSRNICFEGFFVVFEQFNIVVFAIYVESGGYAN